MTAIILVPVVIAPTANAGPVAGPAQQGVNPDPQSIDNIDPATEAIMRRQEAFQQSIQQLVDEAAKSPVDGFHSIAFEDDSRAIALHWKGNLPENMKAALAKAREVGEVRIRAVKHSKKELDAEAERIGQNAGKASDIQQVAFRPDGSGLIVKRMPAQQAERVSRKAGNGMRRVEDVLAAVRPTVPVDVVQSTEEYEFQACQTTCSRIDDSAPWNAGGYMRIQHDNMNGTHRWSHCTSGFGVHVPAHGQTYVLTAAHCASWFAGYGDWFYDKTYEYMGRAMLNEDWKRDIILIDARGFPWMFDGGVESTWKKDVKSWGYHANGEYLCQSGSTSGVVCGLKTRGHLPLIWLCDSDGDCYYVHGLIETNQVDGAVAARKGDSGGPVFSLDGAGVRAKGVISAGNSGSTMLFQDFADIIESRAPSDSSAGWTAANCLTR